MHISPTQVFAQNSALFCRFRDALPSIIVEGVTHNSPHIPSNGVRTPIGPRVRTPVSNGSFQSPVTPEEDLRTQMLSQGMTLLLAARTRVLTLSEQRVRLSYPAPFTETLTILSQTVGRSPRPPAHFSAHSHFNRSASSDCSQSYTSSSPIGSSSVATAD